MKIDLQNVSFTYPNGKKALQGLNLTLGSPCLIGLLGPNGAGKSTLMKLLTAALLPTEGAIAVDGVPLIQNEKILKSRLGYLPQDFGLYDELTVWQFLDYMSALKRIANPKEAIERSIAEVGLEDRRSTRIQGLSGGQRQRVGIAQALLGEPELLIFDEPTVGLDPEERIRFRGLFSSAAQNKLVMLSTHIIEDVQSVCDHLIVIEKGCILFAGKPETLIARAEGHVGTFLRQSKEIPEGFLRVTSQINTAAGVLCRGVARELPSAASPVEATLEDAYFYLLAGGDRQ